MSKLPGPNFATDLSIFGFFECPCPALVVADDGSVLGLNEQAQHLLPNMSAGNSLCASGIDWLISAHENIAHQRDFDSADSPENYFHGWIGTRSFHAEPRAALDGATTWWLLEDTEIHQVTQEFASQQKQINLVIEASSVLLQSLNLDRCMEVAAQLAAEHLGDAAVVVAPESDGHHLTFTSLKGNKVLRDRREIATEQVPGLAEALQGFPPTPSRWVDLASMPPQWIPEGFGGSGSAVITPLPGHGVTAGALVVFRKRERGVFSEAEESVAHLFAARAGIAISAARMFAQQAFITETLMRELLPPSLHRLDGVEFGGRYRASRDHERIGGDFYDVFPAAETGGETLAVLGDVCGKGLEAAVLTGKIRTTLRALLPFANDHLHLLSLLNNALVKTKTTLYATLVLVSTKRVGKGITFRVTCAGHPAPFIVRADGRVQTADTTGTLLGILPEIKAQTTAFTLQLGETCFLFTDGVTEAHGGPLGAEFFGEERLRQVLASCAGMPAEATAEHVHMVVSQWIGQGRHDDIALLAITPTRERLLSAVESEPKRGHPLRRVK